MTTARNTILAGIQEELWTVEWDGSPVALVERNLRRMATIDELIVDVSAFPTLFIVDFPDEVERRLQRTNSSVEYERKWVIGITTFFQGSTEDAAPVEIEEFQELMKKAIYQAANTLGVTIFELATGENAYPDIGNNVVVQTIQFEIIYIDQVTF